MQGQVAQQGRGKGTKAGGLPGMHLGCRWVLTEECISGSRLVKMAGLRVQISCVQVLETDVVSASWHALDVHGKLTSCTLDTNKPSCIPVNQCAWCPSPAPAAAPAPGSGLVEPREVMMLDELLFDAAKKLVGNRVGLGAVLLAGHRPAFTQLPLFDSLTVEEAQALLDGTWKPSGASGDVTGRVTGYTMSDTGDAAGTRPPSAEPGDQQQLLKHRKGGGQSGSSSSWRDCFRRRSSGASDTTSSSSSHKLEWKMYMAGSVLAHPGDPVTHVIIVATGTVVLRYPRDAVVSNRSSAAGGSSGGHLHSQSSTGSPAAAAAAGAGIELAGTSANGTTTSSSRLRTAAAPGGGVHGADGYTPPAGPVAKGVDPLRDHLIHRTGSIGGSHTVVASVGDPLGVYEVLTGCRQSATWVADNLVQALVMPAGLLRQLVASKPGVAQRAWQAAAAQLAGQYHNILGVHRQLAPLNMFLR